MSALSDLPGMSVNGTRPYYDADDIPFQKPRFLRGGWGLLAAQVFGAGADGRPDAWWDGQPLCAETDPDIFFPPPGDRRVDDARAICAQCGIREQCLSRAVESHEEYGIWGGQTVLQRRVERRRRPKLARTHCRKRHSLAEVGLDGLGRCRECRRGYDKARARRRKASA